MEVGCELGEGTLPHGRQAGQRSKLIHLVCPADGLTHHLLERLKTNESKEPILSSLINRQPPKLGIDSHPISIVEQAVLDRRADAVLDRQLVSLGEPTSPAHSAQRPKGVKADTVPAE